MKNLLFIILVSVFHTVSEAQVNKPKAAELLKISESGNFSQLVKLGKQLQFEVVDSSIMQNGRLFYLVSDFNLKKTDLSCELEKNGKILTMVFSTFNKVLADSFRISFKKQGYKSSGIRYNSSPGLKETEDFEKNKFYISFAVKEKQKENNYEFTFFKL